MRKIPVFIFLCLLAAAHLHAQQRYELSSIQFSGNSTFSSSTLEGIISSQETPWWFWKFLHSFTSLGKAPVYFDSTNIPIDIKSLKEYYYANGFFNARFSYSYEVDTADKEVNLEYIITENSPSTYGKVDLNGIDSLKGEPRRNIQEEVSFDTTSRYSQNYVKQNIDKVINILLNNGYMFAKFDSTIIYQDTLANKANVEIYFTTHKRYTVDSIIVDKKGEGASLVSDQLLRRIVGINTGDYYDQEEIRMSQVRLFRTGLFNSIFITGIEKDTTDHKVPLKLAGSIGKLNELSPEVILNYQLKAFNVGLGASYTKKNFLGKARKLTISASFGVQDIQNIDFSKLIKKFSFRDTTLLGYVDSHIKIEQPYLFGKPIFGTWDNYATINKQPDYNLTRYGSKITFEFELPRKTFINFLSTSYNIEVNKEVYRTYNDSLSSKLLSVIGADFGSTTTDNILYPTRGYNLSFQLEEANSLPYFIQRLFNNTYNGSMFYKVVISNSNYISLDRRRNVIFAAKLKTGYLQTFYGDYAGVPISRTFYAGGSNSLRGWHSNELRPSGTDTVYTFQAGVPNVKGGTFLIEGSLEYRNRFLKNFGAVLFTDFGNSFLGYKKITWHDIALDAGFGFRYYTGFAPFRIDIGFKIYNPEDRSFIIQKKVWQNYAIHFGIGEAF